MRVMGYRELWVARVRLPGDVLQRSESDPYVAELAESIRRVGLIQPPIIWWLGSRRKVIIDGRARIAALVKLGTPSFKAVAVETTPDEAYAMYMESHLHRRTVDLATLEETAKPLRSPQPYRTAPPELPPGFQQPPLENSARAQPPEPTLAINEMGMELTDLFREELGKTNLELARATYYLACAMGSLGRIKSRKMPMNPLLLAALERSVDTTRSLLAQATPHALCPWCKGIVDIKCDMCVGARWVPKEQYDVAFPKLKDLDDKVVIVDGVARRLKDVVT